MQTPTHILTHYIPVLTGAPEALVAQRELRTKYETNRAIKTWSIFFLLKSLTTSGLIKNYAGQAHELAEFCQCNKKTLIRRIEELQKLGLLKFNGTNILLSSYIKAASILGINYNRLFRITYNPHEYKGNQIFQHLLRVEEIRNNQQKQLGALILNLEKNPLVTEQLMPLLAKQGCKLYRIRTDAKYLQEQLLKLQQTAFIEGSDFLTEIQRFRADVNRSVNGFKKQHHYKSSQSVSYLKKILQKQKLIDVVKKCIYSKERTRLYVPASDGSRKDGYKWLPRLKKTAWFLTDQITVLTSSSIQKEMKNESEEKKQNAA